MLTFCINFCGLINIQKVETYLIKIKICKQVEFQCTTLLINLALLVVIKS